MAIVSLSGLVMDTAGHTVSFSASASNDAMAVVSVVMTPHSAPPGTMRTLGVIVQSEAGLSMVAAMLNQAVSSGLNTDVFPVANPVPPSPLAAGQQYFEWTFVW